jgi:hypothetical protein
MVSLKLTAIALAAFHTFSAVAQIPEGLQVRETPNGEEGRPLLQPVRINVYLH